MRALIQKVKSASVEVDGKIVGSIKKGLLVFVCSMIGDTDDDLQYIAKKIPELRIFTDSAGKFNLSLIDESGEILLVSQFTLAARTRKGRRPSFTDAASPEIAEPALQKLARIWQNAGIKVEQGRFGALMQVALVNDGPVTIWIDSQNRE